MTDSLVNKEEFLNLYNYFDKELLIEIIDIFISESPLKAEKLFADLTAANYADLRFDAHSLKGAITNFCAPAAKAKVYEVEVISSKMEKEPDHNPEPYDLNSKLQEISKMVDQMIVELKEIKQDLTG